jgi:hypothetical protein
MRFIGFSTGALARSDFNLAIQELSTKKVDSIELSALRFHELRPLLESLSHLHLEGYRYVSVHAPSHFQAGEELETIQLLQHFVPPDWPIVLHPDAIQHHSHWRVFGKRIAIENMDRRKCIGRTAEELRAIFEVLPEARLCFDIGHARQFDTTMTEAYRILKSFAARLCQVHVSEVNSASQHDRLSYSATLAFGQVARLIPERIPLIIESRVTKKEIDLEIESVRRALPVETPTWLTA